MLRELFHRLFASVAKWDRIRLLTGKLQVRILPGALQVGLEVLWLHSGLLIRQVRVQLPPGPLMVDRV